VPAEEAEESYMMHYVCNSFQEPPVATIAVPLTSSSCYEIVKFGAYVVVEYLTGRRKRIYFDQIASKKNADYEVNLMHKAEKPFFQNRLNFQRSIVLTISKSTTESSMESKFNY